MSEKGLPVLTVHDCFKCLYADELDKTVEQAYKNFYNSNYLETHFAETNPFLFQELLKIKNNFGIKEFNSEDITRVNLYKF